MYFIDPHAEHKVENAIHRMKYNKSPGDGNVVSDLFKSAGKSKVNNKSTGE